jgi:hypothetical protein
MNARQCSSQGPESCATDDRRETVRRSGHLAGIDYVEVYPDRLNLCVHFFGSLPTSLGPDNVVIEGGERIRGIRVLRAEFDRHDDGDTCLRVTVDRVGDFSRYCICLVAVDAPPATCPPPPSCEIDGSTVPMAVDDKHSVRCSFDPLPPSPMTRPVPAGIDPRYACADFSFRIDCPSDLDCAEQCGCDEGDDMPPAPAIDYLARDFTSFKRLMLDRMSATMPAWREQHLPDIGITLVELFAYAADQYSYTLDAVATEAYLGTAQHRISIRRHARLLDYRLHEGCNARTWITLDTRQDLVGDNALLLADLRFATLPAQSTGMVAGIVDFEQLTASADMVIFEPIDLRGDGKVELYAAHSLIHFHTWGNRGCCLPKGATRATLRNGEKDTGGQALQLKAGDVLILEEISGADSGRPADADRRKRHAVRLIRTELSVDPLDDTPLLEVAWGRVDALPFSLCLSARTAAPDCQWVEVAVVRGNVVLVDHGETVYEQDDSWVVGSESMQGCCECDGSVADMLSVVLPLSMTLGRGGITHGEKAAVNSLDAQGLLQQDPRDAVPQIMLDMAPASTAATVWNDRYDWLAVPDLLASMASDLHLVAEFDDDGWARLRFGDDQSGRRPTPGERFRARYRVGNGRIGNVGADAIVMMGVRGRSFPGLELGVRNPLAARGGTDPEPVADAKRFAPHAYGRKAERAIVAGDYADIAAADARLDGAHAELVWTGSGYEAVVALDPLAAGGQDTALPEQTLSVLEVVRRIGHDLRCVPVHEVPLILALDVCVLPDYLRAEVSVAVSDMLSSRRLAGGTLGLFHPDRLSFGQDIYVSTLVAAVQALEGVAHVRVTRFGRADADTTGAAASLDQGVIAIACDEIPVLDADVNFPERGTLALSVEGGR